MWRLALSDFLLWYMLLNDRFTGFKNDVPVSVYRAFFTIFVTFYKHYTTIAFFFHLTNYTLHRLFQTLIQIIPCLNLLSFRIFWFYCPAHCLSPFSGGECFILNGHCVRHCSTYTGQLPGVNRVKHTNVKSTRHEQSNIHSVKLWSSKHKKRTDGVNSDFKAGRVEVWFKWLSDLWEYMRDHVCMDICLSVCFRCSAPGGGGGGPVQRPFTCTISPVSRHERRPYKMSESIHKNAREVPR